jgi:hypothetical protein
MAASSYAAGKIFANGGRETNPFRLNRLRVGTGPLMD